MPKTFDKQFQNEVLTNMSKALMNNPEDFVASFVAPWLKVNKDSGEIYGYGTQAIRRLNTARAVGGRYKSIDFKVKADDQWNLKDHGLSAPVLKEEEDNAQNPLRAKEDKTKLIVGIMMLNYEIAVASSISQATIANGIVLSGTSQWSDYTNSTPVADIDLGKRVVKRASGKKANSIMMDAETFSILKRHPEIQKFFINVNIVSDQMLEEVVLKTTFGFKNVAIADTYYDDINLQSGSIESGNNLVEVWSKLCLIFYKEDPTLMSVSLMKTFAKRNGIIASTWKSTQEELVNEKKVGGVTVEHKRDIAFVDNRCGYLISETIA